MQHSTTKSPHVQILMRGHHYAGGISSAPPVFKKGGKACHGGSYKAGGNIDNKDREHHSMGSFIGKNRELLGPNASYSHGGRTRRKHHAAGGAGKVRKGMMD